MSQKVFAYGSNMCSARFRDYGMTPDGVGIAAVLPGYRLRFNKQSVDGSGKANVEPHVGAEVWGVLYAIPDEHLATLDDGEGAGYHRVNVRVRLPDATETDAWVYLARRPSNDPLLRPYTWYRQFLIVGAREHQLPPEYILALEQIEARHDQDEARDATKWRLVGGP